MLQEKPNNSELTVQVAHLISSKLPEIIQLILSKSQKFQHIQNMGRSSGRSANFSGAIGCLFLLHFFATGHLQCAWPALKMAMTGGHWCPPTLKIYGAPTIWSQPEVHRRSLLSVFVLCFQWHILITMFLAQPTCQSCEFRREQHVTSTSIHSGHPHSSSCLTLASTIQIYPQIAGYFE